MDLVRYMCNLNDFVVDLLPGSIIRGPVAFSKYTIISIGIVDDEDSLHRFYVKPFNYPPPPRFKLNFNQRPKRRRTKCGPVLSLTYRSLGIVVNSLCIINNKVSYKFNHI